MDTTCFIHVCRASVCWHNEESVEEADNRETENGRCGCGEEVISTGRCEREAVAAIMCRGTREETVCSTRSEGFQEESKEPRKSVRAPDCSSAPLFLSSSGKRNQSLKSERVSSSQKPDGSKRIEDKRTMQ